MLPGAGAVLVNHLLTVDGFLLECIIITCYLTYGKEEVMKIKKVKREARGLCKCNQTC